MMRSLVLIALLATSGCADPAPRPVAGGPEPPPPSRDTAWTLGPSRLAGEGGTAVVRSVRLGAHSGESPPYDRIVFEVEGGPPGVHVEYVDRPVRTCGSGEALYPEGDGFLEVRLDGARAHTEAGDPTVSHARQVHGLPAIRETVPTCDFEGMVTWVLGVAGPEPYRVFRLRDPARVVVDVRHPAER